MSFHGLTASAAPQTEEEWAATISHLIAAGQTFQAVDACRDADVQFPDALRLSLLGVQACLRCGAVDEARARLDRLAPRLDTRQTRLTLAFDALRNTLSTLTTSAAEPTDAMLEQLDRAARALVRVGQTDRATHLVSGDLLDLLADLYGDLWRRRRDAADLHRARAYALERHAETGDPAVAADAAVMSWHLDDHNRALDLARRALDGADTLGCAPSEALIHAALLLGRAGSANALFAALADTGAADANRRTRMRRDFEALAAAGVAVPTALLDQVRPPVIAICAGHEIDRPGCADPRFPPDLEPAMRRAIDDTLDTLAVDMAFVSGSAGADILFIEALHRRGAEVHIMLPCHPDAFAAARVQPAGGGWRKRFEHGLALAHSVTVLTEEHDAHDPVLLQFANRMIDGSARLQAELLDTEPFLVLAWDYASEAGPGSPAEIMDDWGDPLRLRLIDLEDLRSRSRPANGLAEAVAAETETPQPAPAPAPTPAMHAPPPPTATGRVVRTMLFADVVHFTRIPEAMTPQFWHFMADVRARMTNTASQPVSVESWGDALFVVHTAAEASAAYAFDLTAALRTVDAGRFGLPTPVTMRIGLHAGPVLPGTHPMTGRPMITGQNVNRAARIEAIAQPGQVYASQQFVALLTAEVSSARIEAQLRHLPYHQSHCAEYIGALELPKRFGRQAIYTLRRAETPTDRPA